MFLVAKIPLDRPYKMPEELVLSHAFTADRHTCEVVGTLWYLDIHNFCADMGWGIEIYQDESFLKLNPNALEARNTRGANG